METEKEEPEGKGDPQEPREENSQKSEWPLVSRGQGVSRGLRLIGYSDVGRWGPLPVFYRGKHRPGVGWKEEGG